MEWLCRFAQRGNDEAFIKFQEEHWEEFIDDMDEETYPTTIVLDSLIDERSAITTSLMNDIMNGKL